MFGIGWSEFLVIVCIVIIFIRPKDLPAILQKVGKAYGQLKRAYKEIVSVKDQFVKEMNAVAAENAPTQDSATESVTTQTAAAQNAVASESASSQNNDSASSQLEDPNATFDTASSDAPGDEHLYNESHEELI
ncbi:MAG TPA: twin-arginine translocase TatA/TatE family subunit [Spirochaetales bacterium]|nr:twin-arginine translocase TatA/TatE family subunit [Spirochaetales bacterium]HPS14805.1 twin-arginine translocase TatA/TatE family subunit [Spirochaetales bacterium]